MLIAIMSQGYSTLLNNKLYVTIASDASCGKERTGFAYYIRDDSGTTKEAWAVDKKMDSTMAEITSIMAALKAVSERNYPEKPYLIYYCDNKNALETLTQGYFTTYKARKRFGPSALELMKLTNIFAEVEARHVPAHTNKTELKRYFMNRWCDFNARAMMKHNRLHIKRFPIKEAK